MPVLKLEFEVYCSCGNGLCGNTTEGSNQHSEYITVEPCEKCIDASYDQGATDGYNRGYGQCEKDNEF